MQSGKRNSKKWLLEFDTLDTEINPLMGWESSRDTMSVVQLEFSTKDEAINLSSLEDYKTWKKDPNKLILQKNNGERYSPIKDLMSQAKNFISDLINNHSLKEEQNVLVVAHNAIIRCIILQLLNNPENGFRRLRLDNASISVFNL